MESACSSTQFSSDLRNNRVFINHNCEEYYQGATFESKKGHGMSRSKAQSKAHVDAKLKDLNKKEKQHLPESEFLCAISFKNSLPAVPSGPYFKKVDLSRSIDKFSEYSMSSLEKGYIWQPHFNKLVNIDIDLVDQDTVLQSKKLRTEHDSEKEVKLYLSGAGGAGAGRSNARKEHQANHWWLRDTLYFNNELSQNRKRIQSQKVIDDVDVSDPCDEEVIAASFENAVEGDKNVEANVEWSVPILPSSAVEEDKLYSLAKFLADPEIGSKRMRSSIITNIRVSQKGNGSSYAVSMLEKGDEAEAEAGDGSFKWVKDYRMDLKNNLEDQYVFVLDGKSAKYSSIGSHFDMAKIGIDEQQPHEATVVLR